MNGLTLLRALAFGGALSSLVAGCSGSAAPFDAAVDTGPIVDATGDTGTRLDVVAPSDVVDVAHVDATVMDIVQSVDVADVAPTVDVSAVSDVPPTTDTVDVVHDDVAASDAGAPCVVDSDCAGTGMRCGYLIAQACAATGTCVMTPPPLGCGAITLLSGCGCDGSAVHWTGGCRPQFPTGYAPAAISNMGACP